MLVLHVMSGNASLRQSYSQQSADPRLRTRLGMPEEWVSYSQLARSSSSRPAECFEHLLAALVRRAQSRAEPEHGFELLRKVEVLDSTFFSLSAKASPWSVHGGHEPGVRLQAGLELARKIPTTLKLTLPDTNDATALKEWDLSGLEGWTMVFDLGYYAHAHFERLLGAGVNFVTRLKAQASYEVTQSKALPNKKGATMTPEGDEILSDQVVTLGSPKNSRGAVLKGMRLVTSKNRKGQMHTLITNRHDLTALEVVRLYRKRWQIELFFRWLKRQLGTLHALGESRKAVWLTILVAAIVVVMAMLAEALRPKGLTRVSWLRALCQSLFAQLRFSG